LFAGGARAADHPLGDHRDYSDGLHHLPSGPVQHAVGRAPRGGPTQVDAKPEGAPTPPAPPLLPTPAGGSPRILILFSDTGGGHRAAARALTDALKQLDPSCVVMVADPLIGQGPLVVRRLASLYSPLIQRSRRAW